MRQVEAKSGSLTELFVAAVEATCPDLKLVTPREPARRGSQISFKAENGYAVMQALIDRGVIGDFRAPDIIRFGFTPLYLSHAEAVTAAGMLAKVLAERLWDEPKYHVRAKVT
jgi:kynureninase